MEPSPGCPDLERLRAMLHGTLPEPELTALAGHLEDCEACQNRLETTAASGPFWSRVASHLAHAAENPVRTPTWPGYEVLSELGRGGFGVVYKARQLALKRLVALKTINNPSADADDLARFRREAEAVARLQHPNVVQIFEVGEHHGRPFFSMEYIEGGSLADRLGGTPWPPRRGAELIETLAGAVHAAHEQGVIHRDLKPANILLAPASGWDPEASSRPEAGAIWVPKVTDFGLAKQMGDAAGLTQTGAIVGTPNYMAPEQASGRGSPVGRPADVYALGAVLYEVLTGRPPFQGVGVMETLDQVRNQEPVSPRALQPAVPRDLEAICLKCLRKEPEGRYASALQLAEELGRFRKGESLRHTRRVTALEKVWRWSRRHPARAAAVGLGAVSLVTLTALLVVAVFAGTLQKERERTQIALDQVTKEQAQTDAARREAETFRLRAEELSAELALQRGLNLCERGEVDQGLHWFVRSLKLTPPGSADLERVIRTNLAAWAREVNSPVVTLKYPDPGIFPPALLETATFSPDGKLVLTGGPGGSWLWDAGTGERIAGLAQSTVVAAFSPDGQTILTVDSASLNLCRTDSREQVWGPIEQDDQICAAAFSPDGRYVVAGGADKWVRVWDAATGQLVGKPLLTTGLVEAVAVRPDGGALAAGCEDGTAWLWDLPSRKRICPPLKHDDRVMSVTFSHDGNSLLTTSGDGCSRLFDARTGEPCGQPGFQGGQVVAAAFHPTSFQALTASNHAPDGAGAMAWRQGAFGNVRAFTYSVSVVHGGVVNRVAFNRTGDLALTAGGKEVRLWNPATWRPVGHPLRHSDEVLTAAFSPDGSSVVTGCVNGTGRIWRVGAAHHAVKAKAHPAKPQKLIFSADGRTGLVGDWDRKVHHITLSTGQPVHPPLSLPPGEHIEALAISHDGGTAVASMRGKWTLVWDARTGKPLRPAWQDPGKVATRAAALSPDGRLLALMYNDLVITNGVQEQKGTFLRLWDLTSGQPLGPGHPIRGSIGNLTFSPDGRTLFVPEEHRVLSWDPAAGRLRGATLSHGPGEWMGAAAISPDGRTLACLGPDGSVWLGDVEAGRRGTPFHDSGAASLAFSPDGATLAIANSPHARGGQVVLRDLATGKPLGPPLRTGDAVLALGFADGGKTVLTGGHEGTRFWPVAVPLAGSVEEAALRIQVLTGKEMDDGGVIRLLDAQAWEERRRLAASPSAP